MKPFLVPKDNFKLLQVRTVDKGRANIALIPGLNLDLMGGWVGSSTVG